jgi:nitric oxide reductase NorQ protein
MLKGPTGCGKTRFVEHMAWRLKRPLVTISCHDDLTASDLIGRFLIRHDGTAWQDGPLTRAVREGALCYLDEVVEARQDTMVVLHSLTDHRRFLPIDKTGETITAAPGFQLVVSYNPGYQRMLKDLKPSTRQRFVALDFDFPPAPRKRRSSKPKRSPTMRPRWPWCRWVAGCAVCATGVWQRCRARGC